MTRLRNLVLILAFIAGVAGCQGQEGAPESEPAAIPVDALRPNIIFIMADDLGYGHLGSYGQKDIETPALDRLAANGIRYTQAYAGSTVCAPSRSVLMTGQHTGHTTVRGNWGPTGERVPLKDSDVTVAEVLKRAGYTTGMIGKWGLGEPGTSGVPNKQGFDYWFGFLNQHKAHKFYPEYVWRNDRIVYFDENETGQRETYIQDVFIEETLEFIRTNKDEPFFLYLPSTLPHTELAARPEIEAQYRGKFEVIPWPAELGRPEVPDAKATFAAMVTTLDYDVGRIMDELDALGIADNTLVIFTSDNGPASEHGAVAEYFDGSGPLRGIKRDMYEGGIRVPLIASWPAQIAAGTVDESSHVAFWDFLPTFAELAGVEVPENIDGISVVASLVDRTVVGNDRPLYWEFRRKPNTTLMQAARWGKWKAVRLSEQDPTIELYDLDADIGETNDVASDHPEIVEKFQQFMRSASK